MATTRAGLPFFLRESDKGPPAPAPYRSRWRSFELLAGMTSLEALLQIEDAAELLFEFVWKGCRLESDEDDDDGADAEHVVEQYRNVIWLWEDIFMAEWSYELNAMILARFTIRPEGHSRHNSLSFSICKMPSSAADGVEGQETSSVDELPSASSSSSSPLPSTTTNNNIAAVRWVMDIVFQLLAKHKALECITIERVFGLNLNEPFPVSLDALQVFVNQAQSRRVLCLIGARFTVEQWRVVIGNCHPTVTLYYQHTHQYFTCRGEFDVLIHAMKGNTCPANLGLENNRFLDTEEFLDALASTTSVKCLNITTAFPKTLISLCGAIAKNRGLEKLVLIYRNNADFSDTEWEELVCHSLLSHPTLQSLHMQVPVPSAKKTKERDQVMIRCISRNQVLSKFTSLEFCFHDYHHVVQTVRPFLELNRFRPVVAAIKKQQQTEDETVCHKLLTSTLLSHQVSKCLDFRFWLLKENANLLAAQFLFSRPPDNLRLEKKCKVENGLAFLPSLLLTS